MISPTGTYVLVRVDPPRRRSEFIDLHTFNESNVRTATVLRCGPGTPRTHKRPALPCQLSPGDRIAFFRWEQEHAQGKQVQSVLNEIEDGLALIKERDVLFSFTGDVKVDTP